MNYDKQTEGLADEIIREHEKNYKYFVIEIAPSCSLETAYALSEADRIGYIGMIIEKKSEAMLGADLVMYRLLDSHSYLKYIEEDGRKSSLMDAKLIVNTCTADGESKYGETVYVTTIKELLAKIKEDEEGF